MLPTIVAACLWAAWYISWMAARSWSKPVAARPAPGSERLYGVIAYGGAVLLFASIIHVGVFPKVLKLSPPAQWGCVVVVALGFAICWWARLHLGRNWSWEVTRKQDHQIVDTGPYRLVRHPIYTGVILASIATALLIGKVPSFVALALIIIGSWIKARLEERFLAAELGEKAYGDYARRTSMLFPGL
jgi:protein-S-isoprenylcysteine O-methyltransferase Ste14